MSVTVRATTTASSTGSDISVPLTGAVDGDLMVVSIGAAWETNSIPSGWSRITYATGPWLNGSVFTKTKTSSDSSPVTFSLAGSGGATAVMAAIDGDALGAATVYSQRDASSSAGQTFTSGTLSADANDLMLYFGHVRASGSNPTANRGTVETSVVGSGDFRAALYDEPLAADLSGTVTFATPSSTSGYFFAAVKVLFDDPSPDASANYQAEVLADSPAMYLPAQERIGSVAGDVSGNSRDGSYMGATLDDGVDPAAPAGLGRHVRFDGTDDSILLAGGSWFTPASGFTFEGWFYIRSWGSGWSRLFDFSDYFANSDDMYLAGSASGGMSLRVGGTGVALGSALSTGEWLHVVVTVETPSNTASLYVNDVLWASGTTGTPSDGERDYKRIGESVWSGDPHLATSVTHLALYHSVLPSLRRSAHYAASVGGDSGSLDVVLPVPTVAITGTFAAAPETGTLDAALPVPLADFSGSYDGPVAGVFAAVVPVPTVALAGSYSGPVAGSLAVTLPAPTVTVAGAYTGPGADASGTLAAVLPVPTVSLTGLFYPRNGYGLVLDSESTVDAEAPLPATPSDSGTPALTLHVVTPTVPTPVLVNGRPS